MELCDRWDIWDTLFGLQHGKGDAGRCVGLLWRNVLTVHVLTRDDLCQDLGKV
jgi:hypothetical protein